MNRKKGISAVVATVLIILITVAAVTIIWAAIIPMINNQLDKGTLCLDAVSQVTIVDEGYTCYRNDTGGGGKNVSIQIAHGAKSFQLADIQILLSEGGNTETLYSGGGNLPGPNEEKVVTIAFSTSITPDELAIAPIVSVGNTQETCDVSSTLTNLQHCG